METIEFEAKTEQRFTIRPGDVLLARDVTGTGHAWRLVDDQPRSRSYITIRGGVGRGFSARS